MNIDNLIRNSIENLGFNVIESDNFKYLVKPKNYQLSIIIDLFYNFTKEELERISLSNNSYEIVERETIRLLKRSFKPVKQYQSIYDNETDYYMKNNGYFLTLKLDMLDDYINKL